MEEFDTTNDGRFLHVWVDIIQTFMQGILHVLGDTIKLQRTQRSQRKASNLVIGLLQIHLKGVNGQNG
jgi:hypothetical protein